MEYDMFHSFKYLEKIRMGWPSLFLYQTPIPSLIFTHNFISDNEASVDILSAV
jgi:hypothetical protein